MIYDDRTPDANGSDDFERWFFGGSPPADGWEAHAFEATLHEVRALASVAAMPVPRGGLERRAANEPQLCGSKSVA